MTRLLLLFLAISSVSRAAEMPGTEEAFGVCDSLNFDSEKENCQKVVRNKFFDGRAVKICATLNFGSEKVECLTAVAGRDYTSDREVQMCSKKNFASDKVSCLKEAGAVDRPFGLVSVPVVVPPAPSIDTKEVRDSITEALSQIENNRPFNASRVLQALLKKLPKQ